MKQDGITEKQQRAIVCLLSCKTREQAAKQARIGTTTLYAWLEDPAFSTALEAARRRAVDSALDRLAGSMTRAVDVILDVLSDEKNSPNVRLKAALEMLGLVISDVRYRRLEERLNRFLETHDGRKRRT